MQKLLNLELKTGNILLFIRQPQLSGSCLDGATTLPG